MDDFDDFCGDNFSDEDDHDYGDDFTAEDERRAKRGTVALYADLTPEQRETWIEKLRRDCALSEHGPVEVLAAAEALSDPAQAAELIKQLVERAGITPFSPVVTDEYVGIYARTDGIIEVEHEDPDGTRKEWDITEPRKTIARLLSLQPNAGAQTVLAALRAEKEPGQRLFETYMEANGRKYHVAPFREVDPDHREEWARAEAAFEAPHLAETASLRARVAELESEIVAPLQGLVELHRESSAKWEAHGKEMFKAATERGERIKELEAELEETETMRQAEIKERKRAEARVRHWETATGETTPRIVKAKLHERVVLIAELGKAIELEGCPSDDDICAAFDALHRAKGWRREEPGTLAFFADGARWAWKAALKAYHASLSQELPPELPAPGRDRDAPRAPTVDRMEAEPARTEQDHVHEVGSCSFCDRSLRHGATPCLTWQEPECGSRCRACGGTKEEHQGRAK